MSNTEDLQIEINNKPENNDKTVNDDNPENDDKSENDDNLNTSISSLNDSKELPKKENQILLPIVYDGGLDFV